MIHSHLFVKRILPTIVIAGTGLMVIFLLIRAVPYVACILDDKYGKHQEKLDPQYDYWFDGRNYVKINHEVRYRNEPSLAHYLEWSESLKRHGNYRRFLAMRESLVVKYPNDKWAHNEYLELWREYYYSQENIPKIISLYEQYLKRFPLSDKREWVENQLIGWYLKDRQSSSFEKAMALAFKQQQRVAHSSLGPLYDITSGGLFDKYRKYHNWVAHYDTAFNMNITLSKKYLWSQTILKVTFTNNIDDTLLITLPRQGALDEYRSPIKYHIFKDGYGYVSKGGFMGDYGPFTYVQKLNPHDSCQYMIPFDFMKREPDGAYRLRVTYDHDFYSRSAHLSFIKTTFLGVTKYYVR